MQSVLFEMANGWLELAADLERSPAVRARYQEVDAGTGARRGALILE
jgi:hypothetical protein